MKDKLQQVKDSSVRVAHNAERFVQALSLLTIAGFSGYALQQLTLHIVLEWVVRVALAIIAIRGTYELFRFLDHK